MKSPGLRLAACATLLLLSSNLKLINSSTAAAQQQHFSKHTHSNIFQQFSSKQQASSMRETTSVYSHNNDTQTVITHSKDDPSTTLSSSMLKVYIRANNMRAYHLDLHSYRPEAKYSGDASFVDNENPEHVARCSKHLNQYHELLKSFHELDPILDKNSLNSIKLADSFGRPEAGMLSGNQFWLGNYDNCLEFQHASVKSQYCLAITQFKNWNPSDSKTSIKIGLCLPETCTNSMLNEHKQLSKLVDVMLRYQLPSDGPYSKLKLRNVYCLPHETSEVRQYSLSAYCFFAVIGLFAGSCLYATTIDYMNSKLSADELKAQQVESQTFKVIFIESFSLIRNYQKFMHIREEAPQAEQEDDNLLCQPKFDKSIFLNSITGLKCIGLCWIICAHTFLVAPIPSRNIVIADKLTQTYLADLYLTAHLMVDTFFCLSGVLAAYFIFKENIANIKTKHWVIMTVHRYWRLTPIYLLCYWFTKSVGFLVNSGPLWDYMTSESSPRLNCNRESWFEAIFQLSDFKSPKEHCVPFAWFIANGIKFWMLTPIFLILIHKSIKRGYAVAISTLMASTGIVLVLAVKSNVDMKSVIEFKPESANNMLNNMEEIYTRPYSRIGAYIVGLLAGHMFYMIDSKKLTVSISPNMNKLLWTIFSTLVIVMVFILKIANGVKLDESVIPIIFGISSALIRPLWSLCTCWLVFALAHGQAQGLAKFLSANIWKLLVKLSFCAYLAQGEVIAQLFLSRSSADSLAYSDLITKSIVVIVLTLALSFVMVLMLEYPLIGIEQILLPKKKNLLEKADANKKSLNDQQVTSTTTTTNNNNILAPQQEEKGEQAKQQACSEKLKSS